MATCVFTMIYCAFYKLFHFKVEEFSSWEDAVPEEGDGILRWEWDTEGLWLGIMVSLWFHKHQPLVFLHQF
jgi:hypothetical protein